MDIIKSHNLTDKWMNYLMHLILRELYPKHMSLQTIIQTNYKGCKLPTREAETQWKTHSWKGSQKHHSKSKEENDML
jgi:hypothetical protein